MKKLFTYAICLIGYAVLSSASCKKEKMDVLPEASQEGKNTFGCRVNGELFLPKRDNIFYIPELKCTYFGKYFYLQASHQADEIKVITIVSHDISLQANKTYSLQYVAIDSLSAFYSVIKNGNSKDYGVNSPLNGMLSITKLDSAKKILSGKFSFDAVDSEGNKVEIREGRFDVKFE